MKHYLPPLTKPDPSLRDASYFNKGAYFVATTAWTGHLPASGTWGSFVAWQVHAIFFPTAFTFENWPIALMVIAILTGVGTGVAEVVERMTGVKDDSRVNIDEVVGYCCTVLFLPAGWLYTAPAFLVCRVFDILKPPPARQFQNIHGGVGIMIDDIIAAVYAGLFMHAIIFFF